MGAGPARASEDSRRFATWVADRLEAPRAEARTVEMRPGVGRGAIRIDLRGGAQTDRMALSPASVRAVGFRVTVVDAEGNERRVPPPVPGTFRGTLVGDPESRVAAGYRNGRLRGLMRLGDGGWRGVQSDGVGGHVLYDLADLDPVTGICGVDDAALPLMSAGASAEGEKGAPSPATSGELLEAEIAFDADYEYFQANGSDAAATRLGKRLAAAILLATIPFALMREVTLWRLIELKMELLVQCVPAFLIALHWSRLRTGPVLAGVIVGTCFSVALTFAGITRLEGIHVGIVGCALNCAVAVIGSMIGSGWHASASDASGQRAQP